MLTIEECRQHLGELQCTDEEVERLRDALYAIADGVISNYLKLDENSNPKTS